MRPIGLFALAAVLLAGAAQAQPVDALGAHRLQMEQVRARTELQGLAASVHALQTAQASQQLQDAVRSRPVPYPAELAETPLSSPRCVDSRTRRLVPCPRPPAAPPARKR